MKMSHSETKDWEMVEELMKFVDDLTESEQRFIRDLHQYLDPYQEASDQLSDRQMSYLYFLYEKHCEGGADPADYGL